MNIELGKDVRTQAIAGAQARRQMRAAELDIGCHADAFGPWRRAARQR